MIQEKGKEIDSDKSLELMKSIVSLFKEKEITVTVELFTVLMSLAVKVAYELDIPLTLLASELIATYQQEEKLHISKTIDNILNEIENAVVSEKLKNFSSDKVN